MMVEIRHIENPHDIIFFCRGWSDLDKIRRLVQNDMSTVVIWSKSKLEVEYQYGGRLGEFNDILSQSHRPHCRVLPPGEFSVMIPELHVTFQGAATGRIQWHVIQSHVSHCRVLPLGELTVVILEPHTTLQGAATWWIQWHVIPEPRVTLHVGLLPLGEFTVMTPEPHATLQRVRIQSAILKIVFRHILFYFC